MSTTAREAYRRALVLAVVTACVLMLGLLDPMRSDAAVPTASIQGDPHPQLAAGASLNLAATLSGDPTSVVWKTSAPGVVKVTGNPTGATITALSEGVATISVEASTDEGTATAAVTVSVTDPAFAVIPTAYIKSATPKLLDADAAAPADGTAASGVGVGLQAMSRSYFWTTGGYWVPQSAVRIPATKITVRPDTVTVKAKRTTTLTATVEPELANEPIEWSSSKPVVARVDGDGRTAVVRGRQAGKTKITVTESGHQATATVTVIATVRGIPKRKPGKMKAKFSPGNLMWQQLPDGTRGYFRSTPPGGPGGEFEDDIRGRLPRYNWDDKCDGKSQYYTLQDYPRPRRDWRMTRDYARMYCGKAMPTSARPFTESGFGLRHLLVRKTTGSNAGKSHGDEFAHYAVFEGVYWDTMAHWLIGKTISKPWVITDQNYYNLKRAYRYCYEAIYRYKFLGKDTQEMSVVVLLGMTGVRIMTAFTHERDYQYCDGYALP
ncbi:Ig domain-containing protein [Nocardioides kongjuensis]|uniref:BIG2 domain-containing protein n=1 Tax=Nocardioides kongjuensis TaxID=349522 RepID=A0A852S1I5_9ACTN|nr:hypothetical protein [Nocardioides kongjuensis]